jgi:hypothetical protein
MKKYLTVGLAILYINLVYAQDHMTEIDTILNQ